MFDTFNTIAKHLMTPFMKIVPLPKGQQKGLHGPVVCVPSNISSVIQTLPRQLSDNTLIKVKLKRKLEYKGHHLLQQKMLYSVFPSASFGHTTPYWDHKGSLAVFHVLSKVALNICISIKNQLFSPTSVFLGD